MLLQSEKGTTMPLMINPIAQQPQPRKSISLACVKTALTIVLMAWVPTSLGALTPLWEAFLTKRSLTLQQQGLVLKETMQTSLDGKSQHGVAIFAVPGPRFVSFLEVYELQATPDGGIRVEKLGEVEDWDLSFETLNGQDLNRDGLKEIIIRTSRHGNCLECEAIRIFQIHQRQLKELTVEVDKQSVPKRLEDLDGDGRVEVIAADRKSYEALWEAFCNLCMPEVSDIYVWQNGQYVKASQQFPKFYESRIAQYEDQIVALKQQRQSCHEKQPRAEEWSCLFHADDARVTAAVSLLLNFIHKGEPHHGWERFQELIAAPRLESPEQRIRAQEIVVHLKQLYGF